MADVTVEDQGDITHIGTVAADGELTLTQTGVGVTVTGNVFDPDVAPADQDWTRINAILARAVASQSDTAEVVIA